MSRTTSLAARLEGVSKEYRLGHERSNLRSLIPGPSGEGQHGEVFKALEDVSLEIEFGEAVGIIGHNGAGKSTVLKLLAGILSPTKGSVETRGRIASLIELGVGFDPELTGRENISFAGDLIGLTRAELRHHFDEIVEFSGIAEFLDMPVKRYSTGMAARLGFSLATAVQPDVLLVDEVLSVGDHQFQQKSFERIRQLHDDGSTLVMVSHSLWTVNALCPRMILIDHGRVAFDGPGSEAIAMYLGPDHVAEEDPEVPAAKFIDYDVNPRRDSPVEIREMTADPPVITPGDPVTLRAEVEVRRATEALLAMSLYTSERAVFAERELGPAEFLLTPGRWVVTAKVPYVPLATGRFVFRFAILPEDDLHYEQGFPSALSVATADVRIDGDLTARPGLKLGATWEVNPTDPTDTH